MLVSGGAMEVALWFGGVLTGFLLKAVNVINFQILIRA